jgi:hypothetical protein
VKLAARRPGGVKAFKGYVKRKKNTWRFFYFIIFVQLAAQRLAAKKFNVAEMLFKQ